MACFVQSPALNCLIYYATLHTWFHEKKQDWNLIPNSLKFATAAATSSRSLVEVIQSCHNLAKTLSEIKTSKKESPALWPEEKYIHTFLNLLYLKFNTKSTTPTWRNPQCSIVNVCVFYFYHDKNEIFWKNCISWIEYLCENVFSLIDIRNENI